MDALLFQLLFLSHFFFHHVMPIRRVNDGPTRTRTHTSSQHSLCGNQHSNMSNWIFLSPPFPLSIMSNAGSGVYGCVCMTLFKRVYFSQYHLFSLPLTQLYCIKKTEHNICCQLMYAVMDINGSAAESFTSQKVKRGGEKGGGGCTLCAAYAGKKSRRLRSESLLEPKWAQCSKWGGKNDIYLMHIMQKTQTAGMVPWQYFCLEMRSVVQLRVCP